MSVLRSLIAIVLGYAMMVGGAWFAQEAMLPDVEFGVSSPGALLALGVFTSAGGGVGGAVTALLAPRRPYLHLLPMASLIGAETVALYMQGRVSGPLWFELLAGGSLIAGTFVGAFVALAAWRRLKPAGAPTTRLSREPDRR